MKPPGEWTDGELRDELFGGHAWAGEAFEELLRRERERCAGACEAEGVRLRGWAALHPWAAGAAAHRQAGDALHAMAHKLRGLQ